MAHRQGGKTTGSHTTVTELGAELVDFLQRLKVVSKISIGPIQSFHGAGRSGQWAVKVIDETHCILVVATQNGAVQDLRFYTDSAQEAKLAVARFVRENEWELRFGRLV